MAVTKSALSIAGLTSTGTGNTVQLRRPATRFGWQAKLTGSTKATVKIQGTIDGGQNWIDISTATAIHSTATLKHSSTSVEPFQQVRMICSSMTSGASRKLVGFVNGY